jgi:hypothetical protein
MPRTVRLAALHLALVAMLARALLPAGWMPDTSAQGPAPLVICTMHGPVLAAPPGDTSKHKPVHDDGRQTDICPFAASIHVATPASAVAIAPSTTVALIAAPALLEQSVPSVARHSPQSPRAPPSFA